MHEIVIPGLAIASGAIALLYLGICLYLWLRQRQMIILPGKILAAEPGLTEPGSKPSDLGMDYEEVWLPIEIDRHHNPISLKNPNQDGRLHGWWIPNDSGNSERVLLYLHGNSGKINNNLDKASRFHQLGFAILIFDYRGFGRSEGDFPSEQSLYADTQVALDFLLHTKQIPPNNIYLYGHSLGGAIAIEQATKTPELAGLIIEASFTSMLAMATANPRYQIFPIDLLLNQRFDSIAKLPTLKMPILYIHGTDDEDVPAHMSEELYAATHAPKQLLIVKGANHVNVATIDHHGYLAAVKKLIAQVEQVQASI
ncbi:alpha/beta hydrolase [Thalassoporum mexicanum]|uniref:alpha/beta hydrolase n=1 Tax=Thalassoporum mexicanum TaxID=3457544 RepID=UPI0003154BA6|nr:alpha/beta hydrolase [Pseudanabaena sp. PCC 7367]